MKNSILITIVILAGLSVWYFFSKEQPDKYTGPIEKINLGVFSAIGADALFVIAREKGYFADNGLEVGIRTYPTYPEIETALAKDEIDMGTVSDFTNTETLFNRPTEKIIARMFVADSVRYIAKKSSGIAAFQDLKGKKVGLAKNVISTFLLSRNLEYVGLTLGDVTLIYDSPDKISNLLTDGQVDFLVSYEPFIGGAFIIVEPENIATITSYNDDTINVLLVSDQGFIDAHSSTVKRFITSLFQAEKFIKDSNDKAKKIVAQSSMAKTEDFDRIWQTYRFELDLPQSLLFSMEEKARWIIKDKLTDKTTVPNYLNHIYFDALESVKPEAITIIR